MLNITFPNLAPLLAEMQTALIERRRECLETLGAELLGLAGQAYNEKATGAMGSDGIQWKPVTWDTVLRRSSETLQRDRVFQRWTRIQADIHVLRGRLRAAHRAKRQNQIAKLKRRLEVLRRQAQVIAAIGIDTGRQRASATPGFHPPDSNGGNIFDVQGDAITVGFGRRYSPFFDANRPLLPTELPTAWQQQLEKQAADWGDVIIQQTIGD